MNQHSDTYTRPILPYSLYFAFKRGTALQLFEFTQEFITKEAFYRRMVVRPRTLALLLWVVVSVLLSGCQWDGLNLSGSGGATVAVTTELVGPEHLYPLLNARVELNGETQQTKMSGRASFSNVPRDQLATVQAVTDFASVSQQTMVSASMVWHVPIMLPEMMNADEFRNSLFWEGDRNLRWRRGAEIRVYFDYEHAPNMPLAEREAAEAQAIEEFQSWFPPPGHPAPYLRWGGQVSSPGQANVIVHMMHNEAFAEHYPEHSTAAGVGGVRGIDDTGNAEDCRPNREDR